MKETVIVGINRHKRNPYLRREQIACPNCGHMMAEVDRHKENGDLFVWYECSRNDCDGQWLQRNGWEVSK